MSLLEDFEKDRAFLDELIKKHNELWLGELGVIRRAYWKDPQMRGAILDATESLKQLD